MQQDPFESCSRCKKQNLTCQIDESFRRIGKRSRHAELERRAAELEQENAMLRQQVGTTRTMSMSMPNTFPQNNGPAMYTYNLMGTEEESNDAVESLLNLKEGLDGVSAKRGSRKAPPFRTLGSVMMVRERIVEVFDEYWKHYHRFLPLLDENKPPEHYFNISEYLFWTIIMVGCRKFQADRGLLAKLTSPYKNLMWQTMTSVPQNHHIVKALCLLCTWPLPISSTSQDPTVMNCGLMMNVALQIGLHRPSHAEDFSRSHIHLKEDDIRDRLKTWATCNIVAQSISTGYGLPPQTVYDSTLEPAMTLRTGPDTKDKDNVPLPEDLRRRLELEKFANNVTQQVYGYNANSSSREQALFARMAAEDLPKQFEPDRSQNPSKPNLKDNHWDALYLGAVRLHIRLYAFFEAPTATTYRRDLVHLYAAATEYLEAALELKEIGLKYAPNYIMQMMLAAAYTLCKLLNSFFVVRLEHDREHGCNLFVATIGAVREMSVQSNDLPQRLSEVVVQLWHYSGAGKALDGSSAEDANKDNPIGADGNAAEGEGNNVGDNAHSGDIDDSLQLKLRTRMSMSLVYDCVWRWRDELQGKVRAENLDAAVRNPTSPEARIDSPKFPRRMSQLNSSAGGTPLRPSTSGSAFAGSPTQHQQQHIQQQPQQVQTAALAMDQTIGPAADVDGLAAYGAGPSAADAAMGNLFATGAGQYGFGNNTIYGNSYEFFDPMSWILDDSQGLNFTSNLGLMGDGDGSGNGF